MSNSLTLLVNGGGTRLVVSSWPMTTAAMLSAIWRAIGASLARREQRRTLRELADDNDQHLLRDIGLTRQEAYREAGKWFWRRSPPRQACGRPYEKI